MKYKFYYCIKFFGTIFNYPERGFFPGTSNPSLAVSLLFILLQFMWPSCRHTVKDTNHEIHLTPHICNRSVSNVIWMPDVQFHENNDIVRDSIFRIRFNVCRVLVRLFIKWAKYCKLQNLKWKWNEAWRKKPMQYWRRRCWPSFCCARVDNNRLFRTFVIIVTHFFADFMRRLINELRRP